MKRAGLIAALFLILLPAAGWSEERVDVNTATLEELDRLPGIGPVKARAILDERNANGPFVSVEDLERVKGIGPATVKKLAPLVVVGSPPVAKEPPKEAPKPPPPPTPRKKSRPRPPVVTVELDPALDQESPEGKLNLNFATAAELQELLGVAPNDAKAIVGWRRKKGAFRSITDLGKVPGLSPELFETIPYFVTTRVEVSRLSEQVLIELGVSAIGANAVMAAQREGRLGNAEVIRGLEALSPEERSLLEKVLWF